MKSLLLLTVAVLLLLVISACGGGSEKSVVPTSSPPSTTTPSQTVSPSLTPSSTLSEQPDMATYNKYLSDLGIGRMPPGETQDPRKLEKNVTVFATTDQICLYGNIIMECQLRDVIYDTATGKVMHEGGLPKPMKGGFAGWAPMPVPAGKYEYKVYVGDILVGIFPFEVR
jgi:hypothetical protein